MKTFLFVALYIAMVAALDLGGAVWTGLHAAHPARASVAATAPVTAAPAKTERASRAAGTIPSDT